MSLGRARARARRHSAAAGQSEEGGRGRESPCHVTEPLAFRHVPNPAASPTATDRFDFGDAEFDVVGIGNALVDVIAHADDSFIGAESLVKGSMTLIETERAVSLYKALGSAVEMSGGSAANTMCGVASFGGRA